MLRQLDSPLEPEMVIAVVDGAAVTALSEGWNVKSTAAGLLTDLISLAPWHAALPGAWWHSERCVASWLPCHTGRRSGDG